MSYQLYRTNHRLSGQIKWDLTLESANIDNEFDGLYINNFNLTPISNRISFDRYQDKTQLNYTHAWNIKKYYELNKSVFYQSGVDPFITTPEPIIVEDNYNDSRSELINPYSDADMCGLHRSAYSLTGKQVEILCPVWFTKNIKEKENLGFKFSTIVGEGDAQSVAIVKYLKIKTVDLLPLHSRVVKYLSDYLEDVKKNHFFDQGLLNINLEDKTAKVRGLNVSTGEFVQSRDVSQIATNLLSSEKLLLDADEYIISCFENNALIAPQLINFNFLFDIEEFLTPILLQEVLGSPINIICEAGIFNENNEFALFEKKDFYSNYDYIERKYASWEHGDNTKYNNIFSIVRDNEDVNIQNKNKTNQSIIHWSIKGVNDYIFNVYSGFGGLVKSDNEYKPLTHTYQDSPDIWTQSYSPSNPSVCNWCNHVNISRMEDTMTLWASLDDSYEGYSLIGSEWVNELHYSKPFGKPWQTIIISTPLGYSAVNSIFENMFREIALGPILGEDYEALDGICIGSIDNDERNQHYKSILIKNSDSYKDKLTFYNIKTSLNKIYKKINSLDEVTRSGVEKKVIENLKWLVSEDGLILDWKFLSWINSVQEPSRIVLKNLGYSSISNPPCEELNHYILNNSSLIYRYWGELLPSFVDPILNNIYIKKIVKRSDLASSPFVIYKDYPKQYPSIGHYSYESLNLTKNDQERVDYPFDSIPYEYHWFDNSRVLVLRSNIIIKIEVDAVKEDDEENTIISKLCEIYDVDNDKAKYIYKLYEIIDHDWSYTYDPEDISKKTCSIHLRLK